MDTLLDESNFVCTVRCKRSNKHTSIPYGEWVQEVIETFRSKKLILRVIFLEKALFGLFFQG